MKSILSCIEPLAAAGPFKTLDPFLFCVYHKDDYPAGDDKMQAPRRGNGMDFNPSAPYRMYHGERIPGFPQHPHRGFETITATLDGLIDHTDSKGNAGRYGKGDLQWMTAGKGIVHGEMFPLINNTEGNPCKFFQIWINLPAKSKMVEPAFKMHWAEEVPKFSLDDGKCQLTLWAGSFNGRHALDPPPDSWASQADTDVAIYYVSLLPGGQFTLPAAATAAAKQSSAKVNRKAFFVEGAQLSIGSDSLQRRMEAVMDASQDALFVNSHSSLTAEVLILQGRPIDEPVAQHGPFVMNTQAEIMQAFEDYQRTQFGGWPWKEDAVAFPRNKGRFALQDGKELFPPPPSSSSSPLGNS